mmetsp:Transcript_59508/g.128726  ORF Transcript_59508/g.128726 Transcript_59508/m.128726 type:complete len:222 (-) Transcript_59508:271-936(-)
MPILMPMPLIDPQCGSFISTSRDFGEENTTRFGSSSSVIGRSSTPLLRGSTAPLATKPTMPAAASCWRQASWSSTAWMCFQSASWSRAEKKRAPSTAGIKPQPMISAARWPSIVLPRAGRARSSLTSTKFFVAATELRERTNCPGTSTWTFPPFEPDQPPPLTTCVQSVPEPPAMISANARMMKSHSAELRVGPVRYSVGKPASFIGTRTRNDDGGAYGSL